MNKKTFYTVALFVTSILASVGLVANLFIYGS